MAKKNHKRKVKSPKKLKPPPTKKNFLNKVLRFLKRQYHILVIIFTVISWFFYKDDIVEYFSTKHEKFVKEKFIKGVFLPPALDISNNQLIIESGGITTYYQISKLKEGIEIKVGEYVGDLKFKIEKNRLFVSTTFRDIQKEEVVGIINYKSWSLLKDNLLDYIETDESFEVIDRNGNVIFSIKYKAPNIVSLKGYFIKSSKVFIIDSNHTSLMNLNNKTGAITQIQKITRLPK